MLGLACEVAKRVQTLVVTLPTFGVFWAHRTRRILLASNFKPWNQGLPHLRTSDSLCENRVHPAVAFLCYGRPSNRSNRNSLKMVHFRTQKYSNCVMTSKRSTPETEPVDPGLKRCRRVGNGGLKGSAGSSVGFRRD